MPRIVAVAIAMSACALSACSSHDTAARSASAGSSPVRSTASSSMTSPTSTRPTQAAASSETSTSSSSASTDVWDPQSSVCDLLTPVAREAMGLEPLPMGTTQAPSECVAMFQATSDGLTPKLTLNRVQDTVDNQVMSFQQGVGDAEISSANGPTGGAKWVFAHGNPDLEMLLWSGPDGFTWTLETEVANPAARKAAMLEAAQQINTRIPSK